MYTIVAPVPENLATALTPYRQKYDPLAEFIPPHITILRPFDFSRSTRELHDHLQNVGEHQAPIKVSLAGWDVYRQRRYLLCLPVIAGQSEFTSLRENILTGPLSPLVKQDSSYRPHIVFGRLASQSDVDSVKKTLKTFEPQFVFRVTHMDLLQRNTLDEPWQLEKRFGLKATVSSLSRKQTLVNEHT